MNAEISSCANTLKYVLLSIFCIGASCVNVDGNPSRKSAYAFPLLLALKCEHPVIVEQRVVDDVLVGPTFTADLQRVVAVPRSSRCSCGEVVAARIGAGNRRLSGEVSGNREAREVLDRLDLEVRINIAERRRRIVDARAVPPHVGEAQLIDLRGAQDPRVGDVQVLLFPGEVAIDPGECFRCPTTAACRPPSAEVADGE